MGAIFKFLTHAVNHQFVRAALAPIVIVLLNHLVRTREVSHNLSIDGDVLRDFAFKKFIVFTPHINGIETSVHLLVDVLVLDDSS